MFYLHCSKQLLNRVSSGVNEPAGKGDNILGNWYAKAIFSKPQVALFDRFLQTIRQQGLRTDAQSAQRYDL